MRFFALLVTVLAAGVAADECACVCNPAHIEANGLAAAEAIANHLETSSGVELRATAPRETSVSAWVRETVASALQSVF